MLELLATRVASLHRGSALVVPAMVVAGAPLLGRVHRDRWASEAAYPPRPCYVERLDRGGARQAAMVGAAAGATGARAAASAATLAVGPFAKGGRVRQSRTRDALT